ncbi:MAG TPA: WG repeat-containing protein [Vicinamibacterales bacterium]|nr:WG repeat-containing protein [Vicinamibacterales bacterium]
MRITGRSAQMSGRPLFSVSSASECKKHFSIRSVYVWASPLQVLRTAAFVAVIAGSLDCALPKIRETPARLSHQQPLLIVQDGRYGFIDHSGRIVIPPRFLWASGFWRGLATVYVCGRLVSIDKSGNLWPLRIAAPGELVPESHGKTWGFLDDTGRFRIPPRFEQVLPYREGLAAVEVDGLWGFIDTRGRQVIAPRFSHAFYFRQGVATAYLGSTSVLIDRSGRILASGYSFVEGIVSHGRVPAYKNGKSGYLDLLGNVAIPFIYDSVTTFSNGLAAVRQGNKWGYVDGAGDLVIPFLFDEAGSFGSGLAPIKAVARTAYIEKSGRVAFDLPADQLGEFLTGDEEYGMSVADSDVASFYTSDDRFGIVNTTGKVIWGPATGAPFHAPLFGWTWADLRESCRFIPEWMRIAVARIPR